MARRGLKKYLSRNTIVIFLLGMSSGLPLAMISSSLGYWLTESKIDIKLIGAFALVGIFYNLKFLWAPAIDAVKIPILNKLLGRRRSWLLISQIALSASIAALSLFDPVKNLEMVIIFGLAISFFSATQDIVIDAYRIDIFDDDSQAFAAALYTYGYRIALLISGAAALKLSEYISWHQVYLLLAATILIGIFATLLGHEPSYKPKTPKKFSKQLKHAIIDPFADFMQRKGWIFLLIFIIIYKFPAAFLAGGVMSAFYLKMGFSKDEIIFAVQIFGFTATLLGLFVGGVMAAKLGLVRAVFIDAILQAVTNLLFIPVIYYHSTYLLAGAVALENFASAMGTVVLVAFISSLCNREFSATQYALFSSLAALGRTLLAANSGVVVAYLGWQQFFFITFLAGIPAIVLVPYIKKYLGKPVDKHSLAA